METPVTDVVLNKYETAHMCAGKTSRSKRCKHKTRNSFTCYGIELPVCKYHQTQNVILKWSMSRSLTLSPEKIKNYLHFYIHCVNINIPVWLSVVVAAELYMTECYESAEDILQLFRNSIFKPTVGECSVCYDTLDNALETRCGHIFCEPCLAQWTSLNITCPMCRKIISQP